MELFASDTHFVLVDGNETLWIDRLSGGYEAKTGSDNANELGSTVCLGSVGGYMGKLRMGSQTSETRLVFIRQHSLIGMLKGCPIYKISSVVTVPMEEESEILIEQSCKSNDPSGVDSNSSKTTSSPNHNSVSENSSAGLKPLIKIKTPAIRSFSPRKVERQDKVEKRMLEEFQKMFTEADSFYFSPNFDVTNSIQRQHNFTNDAEPSSNTDSHDSKKQIPSMWERADSRFFWNSFMVESLINAKDKKLFRWIIPIIQGFIQHESCVMEQPYDIGPDIPIRGSIDLWLISRRSRFQAGTRYLRRGVDECGKVANYVETEQILIFKSHMISFIQIRGSIPVFWSQATRYRYRPPPKLERDDEENYNAFRKHFEEELSIYQHLVIVNLVEKSGKEKVLGDAFLNNILRHNSPDIVYTTFDFHESCRGMKFENVSLLITKLNDIIKTMNYSWIDSYGTVLKQTGAFRINCVDCLDRTNVVQTHLAKDMLTIQLSKLGLIVPEIGLTSNIKKVLQTMWANNGDTISKQYAGTNALKGDFTRTGERRITGVMKDGMNSANRYYLNRFKDASRQAAIDLMLGIRKTVTEADLTEEKQPFEKENTTEQIKSVIEDVKRCVIPPDEVILGSWGLVNAKLNEPDTIDIDAILILTESHYYVTEYDCTMDTMTDTQKVYLGSVESMELGFDNLMQPTTFWNIFYPGNNSSHSLVPNLQINYQEEGQIHSHEFRSSNIRFFNNFPVLIQQPEEMHEALRMLAESVKIAVAAQGKEVQILQLNVAPQKDTSNKTRIPGMATSWVHRYFTSGQQEGGNVLSDSNIPLTKKITVASFDRFTPKYFRRGSNATVQDTGNDIPMHQETTVISERSSCITSEQSEKTEFVEPINRPPDLHLDTMQHIYPDLIDLNSRTPLGSQPIILMPAKDLVLPSCGIITFAERRKIIDSSLVTTEMSNYDSVRSGTGFSPSPITPISDSISQEVTIDSSQSIDLFQKLPVNSQTLQKHRYSLPANTLSTGVDFDSPKGGPRAKTPEITITEERQSPFGDIIINYPVHPNIEGLSKLPIASRRISRSSEDVNKISSDGRGIAIANSSITGFKLPTLFPLNKRDTRATSQQNISDSSINMRGSHSDNALRENHPFPNNQTTHKRDLVFAPLGKLARGMQNLGASYLDPRKLRDSFKPIGKQDVMETDPHLEERKRQCQTLIIDI